MTVSLLYDHHWEYPKKKILHHCSPGSWRVVLYILRVIQIKCCQF
uniref:ORF44n n=1 Tax=Pinus koraiensis TaxID=88728 RepID=A4QME7_PINKO|nr:ORF44n [Pinus koraiensis]ABP35484.1 ORF44n [Pinus koraiensis]